MPPIPPVPAVWCRPGARPGSKTTAMADANQTVPTTDSPVSADNRTQITTGALTAQRNLVLPHTLQRLEVQEANFVEDRLEIRFARNEDSPARAGSR